MSTQRPLLGVVTIVVSVLVMSLGDALIKLGSAGFTAWQVFTLRSLLVIPILVTLMLVIEPGRPIRPRSPLWVGTRSLLLGLSWVAYYAALPWISLSTAAVAFYTAPLFIALLSRMLLGEHVGPVRWAGIVLGFVGVLVVLRPGGEAFHWATLLPILAALLYAFSAMVIRRHCLHERPMVLALGLNVVLLLVGLIASAALSATLVPTVATVPFLTGPWADMSLQSWGLMLLLAVLMTMFGAGTAFAYQIAPAALIAGFDYSYVAFAVLWTFIFFAETPDGPTILGLVVIAAAGMVVACAPAPVTSPSLTLRRRARDPLPRA
ncbi:MAG: DMT family transporter [Geminicoccaceae bacterium]